jgi:hypothetical protein
MSWLYHHQIYVNSNLKNNSENTAGYCKNASSENGIISHPFELGERTVVALPHYMFGIQVIFRRHVRAQLRIQKNKVYEKKNKKVQHRDKMVL